MATLGSQVDKEGAKIREGREETRLEQSGEGWPLVPGLARTCAGCGGGGELGVVWELDIVLRTGASLRDSDRGEGRGLGCQAEGLELWLQVLGSCGRTTGRGGTGE